MTTFVIIAGTLIAWAIYPPIVIFGFLVGLAWLLFTSSWGWMVGAVLLGLLGIWVVAFVLGRFAAEAQCGYLWERAFKRMGKTLLTTALASLLGITIAHLFPKGSSMSNLGVLIGVGALFGVPIFSFLSMMEEEEELNPEGEGTRLKCID